MTRPSLRWLAPALKAALPALLVAGFLRQVHAVVLSWNADDLRGVWVMTCPLTLGRGTYYIQFSMGGSSQTNNTTLEVLGGGTYQENDTRSVTGGSFTVSNTGGVTTATNMTLVNQNAVTSTWAITTAGAMQQSKDTITGITATDSLYGANSVVGASAVRISDAEVANGQSSGQACFLSGSRR